MEVEFAPRGVGWRNRGRPPRHVPPHVMDLLRRTHQEKVQAIIPITDSTDEEVKAFIALLKRGTKNLGKHLRFQVGQHPDPEADCPALLFFVEDKPVKDQE